jgi:hypothetical protein
VEINENNKIINGVVLMGVMMMHDGAELCCIAAGCSPRKEKQKERKN